MHRLIVNKTILILFAVTFVLALTSTSESVAQVSNISPQVNSGGVIGSQPVSGFGSQSNQGTIGSSSLDNGISSQTQGVGNITNGPGTPCLINPNSTINPVNGKLLPNSVLVGSKPQTSNFPAQNNSLGANFTNPCSTIAGNSSVTNSVGVNQVGISQTNPPPSSGP